MSNIPTTVTTAPRTLTHVDDVDDVSACPACGEPVDYCQGHGAIGDPHGANVLDMHDAGEHVECHPAGCDVADDVRRQAYGA